MIINPVDIVLKPSKRLNIYQDTDTHIGADGHDANLHRTFVKTVAADPDGRWVHTGDMIDEDRPSTRDRKLLAFYDRREVLDNAGRRERREIREDVLPRYRSIAKKCLGIIEGDHYRVFSNGQTSGQYIAEKLGVPYLGERMAYISIKVSIPNSRQCLQYNILARHGKGAASTPGGDVSALMRQNVRWEADLFLGGHTHQENVHPEPVMGVNKHRTNLASRTRWYIRGGSFLRGFAVGAKQLYPEKNEYGPLCIGWGQVEIQFGKPEWNNSNLAIMHSKGSVNVG